MQQFKYHTLGPYGSSDFSEIFNRYAKMMKLGVLIGPGWTLDYDDSINEKIRDGKVVDITVVGPPTSKPSSSASVETILERMKVKIIDTETTIYNEPLPNRQPLSEDVSSMVSSMRKSVSRMNVVDPVPPRPTPRPLDLSEQINFKMLEEKVDKKYNGDKIPLRKYSYKQYLIDNKEPEPDGPPPTDMTTEEEFRDTLMNEGHEKARGFLLNNKVKDRKLRAIVERTNNGRGRKEKRNGSIKTHRKES